jgi:DNA-binding MarR family transcriptional regulator
VTQNHEQTDLFVHTMPGHFIRRVQQVAVRLFAEGVSGDITPVQFAVLTTLDDCPDLGQAALAAMIGYDRATIGGVIDRLEVKGLVHRAADPNDRRSNVLSLTKDGLSMLAQVRPQVVVVQEKLLEPLDEGERKQYARMCRKILGANGG